MPLEARLIDSLERTLKREIQLYQDYLALLKEERGWVTRYNAEKIQQATSKRELLTSALREANEHRLELTASFPDHKGMRLSALIQRNCSPEEIKRLLPLTKKLRAIIDHTHRRTREFNSVLDFGVKIVDGLLSIFWSATQHVSRSYGMKGEIKESMQPQGTRASNILKRA